MTMLKLVALPLVNQIACTRDSLMAKLNAVNEGNFVVTIGDATEREDDETKRILKPTLKQHLRERIKSLEHDLAEYGVDVYSDT